MSAKKKERRAGNKSNLYGNASEIGLLNNMN